MSIVHRMKIRKFIVVAGSVTALSTSIIALTSCGLNYGSQIYQSPDNRASIYFNKEERQIIYIYDLGNTTNVLEAKTNYNTAKTEFFSQEAKNSLSQFKTGDIKIQYLLFKTRGREAHETLPFVGIDLISKTKIEKLILADCGWGTDDIDQILGTAD